MEAAAEAYFEAVADAEYIHAIGTTDAEQYEAALDAAALVYSTADATAKADRQRGIAQAEQSFTATVYGPGGADRHYQTLVNAAEYQYVVTEANAWADARIDAYGLREEIDPVTQEVTETLGVVPGYEVALAESWAALMSSLATENGSPWAELLADLAEAEAKRVGGDDGPPELMGTAEAMARLVTIQALANLQRELAAAAADEVFANEMADNYGEYQEAKISEQFGVVLPGNSFEEQAAAANAYHSVLPGIPEVLGTKDDVLAQCSNYGTWSANGEFGTLAAASELPPPDDFSLTDPTGLSGDLLLGPVCFAAGTPILMAAGTSKPIEEIQPGEMVLAASDKDPEGPVEAKSVIEVYHNRPDPLIELTIGEQTIRCTLKHPFYARQKGWTAASELEVGDGLRTHEGGWIELAAKENKGEVEPVHNLQVEDHHTYFVGSPDCGFSILVHNQSGGTQAIWRGAVISAKARGLPTYLFSWNERQQTDIVTTNGGPAYRLINNNIYYPEGPLTKKLRRVGTTGKYNRLTDRSAMASLCQESFHAWFDHFDDTLRGDWLKKIYRSQAQFGRKGVYKAEEAMSELIAQGFDTLELGRRLPTYDEVLEMDPRSNWGNAITPGHTDPGEKWFQDPGASVRMTEELYYATLYILKHGSDNRHLPNWWPGQDLLPALKEFFRTTYRPDLSREWSRGSK